MIIFDTCVVSELMRVAVAPEVVRWLTTVPSPARHITAVTRGELQYGVARLQVGRRHLELESSLARWLEVFAAATLAFDAEAADRFAEVLAARVAMGRPIAIPDAQIAAITSVHNATLATRNLRDFEDCGIRIVNPFDSATW